MCVLGWCVGVCVGGLESSVLTTLLYTFILVLRFGGKETGSHEKKISGGGGTPSMTELPKV